MNWQCIPLTTAVACLLAYGATAQSEGNFPYNPDSNNNQTIETVDLIEFLTLFGSSFNANGVLPIEGGGTGVSLSLIHISEPTRPRLSRMPSSA